MKVVRTYTKDDLNELVCLDKNLIQIMNNFFKRFPETYRLNYDKNIKDVRIWKVDEDIDGLESSHYYAMPNLLTFQNEDTLSHEFMHMASMDRENNKMAFMEDLDNPLFEHSLVEGMTEYLSCMAIGSKPYNYFFEYFVISMLSSIDSIFEPFFIPNYNKFISLFPNSKDIYSLMYSMDYYHERIMTIEECSKREIMAVKRAIDDTIDTLIDIELSFDKSFEERKKYASKFMDLISDRDIYDFIRDINSGYKNYANKQIKKRILGR